MDSSLCAQQGQRDVREVLAHPLPGCAGLGR
jgi:hypothetical protein